MIVYVPVGNGPLRREIVSLGHGMIVQASDFRFPKLDCPWVLDNGAFDYWKNGLEFNEKKFDRAVERIMDVQPCQRPAWALCPDKVADPGSLAFSVNWRETLPDDLRWFLAIQDGMRPETVDLALARVPFNGLFIGGSTNWKNQMAAEWCLFGRSRKLPVHIGRVNGWKRLQWAVNIGADSIDGTGWTRDPRWTSYLRDLPQRERMVFDGFPEDGKGYSRVAEGRKAHVG